MDQICKGTYIFLALEAAIADLKLEQHREALSSLLLSIIKQKISSKLNQLTESSATHLKGKQILEREFPFEEEKNQIMKYSSVLYQLVFPPKCQAKLKVNSKTLCSIECFSELPQSKKDLSKEKSVELTQKESLKLHKELREKVNALLKTRKQEIAKKKKEKEKLKRQAAKQLQLATKSETTKKKKTN